MMHQQHQDGNQNYGDQFNGQQPHDGLGEDNQMQGHHN